MILKCRPQRPRPSVVRERVDIASSYTWDLSSIFASWEAWEEAYSRPRTGDRTLSVARRQARRGRRAVAAGLPGRGRAGAARVSRVVFRGASLRRRSARQRRRRPPAARADSDRAVASGHLVVQPRAAADSRSPPCVSGWPRPRSWRSIALPSRTCSASRRTCSTPPASSCCRCRGGWRPRLPTPTRRCPRPMPGSRPSRYRPASRCR